MSEEASQNGDSFEDSTESVETTAVNEIEDSNRSSSKKKVNGNNNYTSCVWLLVAVIMVLAIAVFIFIGAIFVVNQITLSESEKEIEGLNKRLDNMSATLHLTTQLNESMEGEMEGTTLSLNTTDYIQQTLIREIHNQSLQNESTCYLFGNLSAIKSRLQTTHQNISTALNNTKMAINSASNTVISSTCKSAFSQSSMKPTNKYRSVSLTKTKWIEITEVCLKLNTCIKCCSNMIKIQIYIYFTEHVFFLYRTMTCLVHTAHTTQPRLGHTL